MSHEALILSYFEFLTSNCVELHTVTGRLYNATSHLCINWV